ncbi:hypothetical protein [Enterococcus italicus]|uniref:hypothetical protein n=1 Tax=Enterococcus italicus TaxID=246144 RepID=UPI0028A7DD8D|nr:hypothetical protein [Enterococcus italicus]
MNKKRSYLYFICGTLLFISGFFLHWLINNLNFYDTFTKLVSYNILGNIIDLIGSIVIAITSAIIASVVSKNEIRKSGMIEKNRILIEKRTYLQLLKLEIDTHLTVFNNIIENSDAQKDSISDFIAIETTVWDKYNEKMHLDSESLEKMYKYYLTISKFKELQSFEVRSNDYKVVRQQIQHAQGAIKMITSILPK